MASSQTADQARPEPEEIRAAIDQQLKELRALIEILPDFKAYKLSPEGGSMRLTVRPEAVEGTGRTTEEPGSAKQYYFEEQELLVVDLSKP